MALLETLLLPPLLNAWLILLGGLLWMRRQLIGGLLVVLGLGGLVALATPLASHALRQGLEPPALAASPRLDGAGAIVILGGGRDYAAPEFGWGDAPANATWRRLAYGAFLHRRSGRPILVSGGRVHDEHSAEASLMAAALREVFEVPVRWLEGRSASTAENARFSAEMLAAEGIGHVALVSQAWHLPRAAAAFERAGLTVTPAPTEFASPPPGGLAAWRPSAYHLHQSTRALREWLGRGELWLKDELLR
ncbi:YdcF family protein [Halomonas koreensis]|uniref:YdcF family protein n=1 Tax=Halomonas koreensis TaxID=245385 RepID=A0ABU1G0N0_9GAMM|nr:YdcF family protein [Halomonas koreensis]MDR5866022.1 YdcF family protein [Halomonas koreensis]